MGVSDLTLLQEYGVEQKRRALSYNTIKRRRQTLSLFARWLGNGLLGASTEQIEEWLDSLGVSARTRSLYLSYLSTFYGWCVRSGQLVDNPVDSILRPKVPRTLPRPISDESLVLAVTQATPRMRCWLLLASLGGLRAGEIARLRREDVLETYDPPMLRIAGKGGHTRLVPLHPDVLSALRRYELPRVGWMWPGKRGSILPETVTHKVSDYLHGLEIDATCHQLRHWFGSHLYHQSHDLRMTQEMMGHASVTTTSGYVAWSPSDAVVAVNGLSVR